MITSRACGTSGPDSRVNVPNSTALRYRNELSKLDRAMMMPLRSVTATHTELPAAARRIHPDPVEPWTRMRSPSRAIAVGITTAPPFPSVSPTCARNVSSRRRSSSARSVTVRSRMRVSVVLLMPATLTTKVDGFESQNPLFV